MVLQLRSKADKVRQLEAVQQSGGGVLQADGGWTMGEPRLGVPALCRTVLLDCNRVVQDVLEDDPLARGPALPRRAELEKTGQGVLEHKQWTLPSLLGLEPDIRPIRVQVDAAWPLAGEPWGTLEPILTGPGKGGPDGKQEFALACGPLTGVPSATGFPCGPGLFTTGAWNVVSRRVFSALCCGRPSGHLMVRLRYSGWTLIPTRFYIHYQFVVAGPTVCDIGLVGFTVHPLYLLLQHGNGSTVLTARLANGTLQSFPPVFLWSVSRFALDALLAAWTGRLT